MCTLDGVDDVKDAADRTLLLEIVESVARLSTCTERLRFELEDCDSYYKVSAAGFRDRMGADEFISLYAPNSRLGWVAVAKAYAEFDTRRVVVEVNKEAVAKHCMPPVDVFAHNHTQFIEQRKQQNGHGAAGTPRKRRRHQQTSAPAALPSARPEAGASAAAAAAATTFHAIPPPPPINDPYHAQRAASAAASAAAAAAAAEAPASSAPSYGSRMKSVLIRALNHTDDDDDDSDNDYGGEEYGHHA